MKAGYLHFESPCARPPAALRRPLRAYSCHVAKEFAEIRDPIHVFVEADQDELDVVNSRPFQRLRHIHQLALTYLIYPCGTHRRFEHSLGVMQLAGRIYDVVMREENPSDVIREVVPTSRRKREYWRSVLRMAAAKIWATCLSRTLPRRNCCQRVSVTSRSPVR
jgi:hypothetical protein